MKTISKIMFAAALTSAAVAPQLVDAAYLENPSQTSMTATRAQHVLPKHIRLHRAIHSKAKAYEPTTAPTSVDFGIGSQS